MKAAFPVYLIPIPEGYQVHFPDMPNCVTWGEDAADALNMAQDALSVCLLSMEDHKQALPQPSAPTPPENPSHIMAMVPVDTEAYRRQTDTRAVRKSVSLPAWMADLADQRGVSYSKVLQESLRTILDIT
ncbi:MAG TPA: HicB family protein [Clostridiales bacterium]|nr:HicB family protein [Clostridiales bacterium]